MIHLGWMALCVAATVVVGLLPSAPLDDCDPAGTRAQSLRRAERRGTVMFALCSITALLALHAWTRGAWGTGAWLVLVGSVAALTVQPGLLVRWLLVPCGCWRWARAASRWGGPPWLRDPAGGATLMGVLALRRRRGSHEDALRVLERGLLATPLRGAGLVASGLIEDLRGRTNEARRMLRSVDDLDPEVCPPLARAIASDWLLEDAIGRQRWTDARIRADAMTLPNVQRMHAVSRRLLGRGSWTHDLRAWFSALARRSTSMQLEQPASGVLAYPVVDHALRQPAANGYGLAGTSAASLHVEAIRDHGRGTLSSEQLHRLGRAWDDTLWDVGLRTRIRTRSNQLNCTLSVEETMVEFHRALCVEVAALLPPVGQAIPRGGKTLERAVLLFHDAQVHGIDAALARLDAARIASMSPSSVELWSSWLEVQDGYRLLKHVATVDPVHAFRTIDATASTLVHWLWHTRGERPLANAIASWLTLEADRVHEDAAAAYHRQYVAAGP